MLSGISVKYAFRSPDRILAGIDICFATYNRTNRSFISLDLREGPSGRLLAHGIIEASKVADWGYHPWRFGPLDLKADQEYILRISGFGAGFDSCLGLAALDRVSKERLGFWINGRESPGEPALAFVTAEHIPFWNSPLIWLAAWIGFCLIWLIPAGFNEDSAISPVSHPKNTREETGTSLIEYLGCGLLIGGCLAFRVWRATKGIDFSDEGMLLATSWRYSLGDLPFRHEIMNTFRLFDVMISPLFRLWPELTLLQLRLFGLFLQTLSLAAAFLFLKKLIRPLILAALLSLILVAHDTLCIFVPSYNLVSAFFSLLSLLAWLAGLNAASSLKTVLLSSLAGVLGAGAMLSYFSLISLIAIPGGVFLIGLIHKKGKRAFVISGLSFLLSCLLVLSLAAGIVISKGLGPDFLEVVRFVAPLSWMVGDGLSGRMDQVLRNLVEFAPPAVIGLSLVCLALFLTRTGKSMAGPVLGLALLLGTAWYFILGPGPELRPELLPRGPDQDYLWYYLKLPLMSFAVITGVFVLGLGWITPLKRNIPRSVRRTYSLGILWGLAAMLTYSLSTNALQSHAGFNGVPILLLFSMTGVQTILERGGVIQDRKTRRPRFVSLIILLVPLFLLFATVRASFDLTYRDGLATSLTTVSYHPKLAGIESSEKRMRDLDRLLLYLEDRVKPGDYFLAMNNLPLLYFLTKTRPVSISAWIPLSWPQEIYDRIYERIIQRGLRPEYCVRFSPRGPSAIKAEDKFLSRGYGLEKTIGPYQVWHRTGE